MNEAHKLDDFDCGAAVLNVYLQDRALDNQVRGYANTYVIADDNFRVVGYCSLCSSMIGREHVPRQIAGHGAPENIPVVLLARLAVDKDYQGQKLGADLLKHAFLKSILSVRSIGASAMLVHAKDEKAANFYRKYGFRPAKNFERAMLYPIKDIIASLAAVKRTK
ncbi:GNAT family N-acetyltransferase [Rhizobium sp.]